MQNREIIEEMLFEKYLDKDVTIILKGGITTEIIIHSAKILLSDISLILTDTKKEEFIIDLSFVTNTKVDNAITFELEEQKVTLDY
jgi:hypothetical protein